MTIDNLIEDMLVTLESQANFMRGMTLDPRLNPLIKQALISEVQVLDKKVIEYMKQKQLIEPEKK